MTTHSFFPFASVPSHHDDQALADGAHAAPHVVAVGDEHTAVTTTAHPFLPMAPRTWDETGVKATLVETLVLKFLLNVPTASGREIADQVALPFGLVETLLHRMKADRLVVFKASAPLADYVYEITDEGLTRARRYWEESKYASAAPVPHSEYVASVESQSARSRPLHLESLREAFRDMVLGDDALSQIGEAVNDANAFFLYGAPGNGKTTVAERVIRVHDDLIWIPRVVDVGGQLVSIYDPSFHQHVSLSADEAGQWRVDRRWVRIRRPTIVVGGELTIEQLEVSSNATTGIDEAPIHVKANGGALVIDDFGRQRVSPAELFNRWIVPLERQYDLLRMSSGRTFQVPFNPIVVFATNLDPAQLVDEAFLRRVPYKIAVNDPTEGEFRELFHRHAQLHGLAYSADAVDYLLAYYSGAKRPRRFCHARDLLRQVRNFCQFRRLPLVVTKEALDAAVKNYFGEAAR